MGGGTVAQGSVTGGAVVSVEVPVDTSGESVTGGAVVSAEIPVDISGGEERMGSPLCQGFTRRKKTIRMNAMQKMIYCR